MSTENPSPSDAPAASATPSPAPDIVPSVTPSPAAEAPVQNPPESGTDSTPAETTLLADATDSVKDEAPKEDPKPEAPKDEAPKDEVPKEEPPKEEKPAELPTYEFELPEEFKKDDPQFVEFTKELGEFEQLSKADHAEVQKLGQRLVEKHNKILQETVQRVVEAQQTEWTKTKTGWKDEITKDPEIGGNRTETTKTNIQRFIRNFGGTEDQRKEFSSFMNETGLGDHPHLVRMIAKAGEVLAEGRPIPAGLSAPADKGVRAKINKMYTS